MRSSTCGRYDLRRRQSRIFTVLLSRKLCITMDGAYFLFCGAPQKRKGIDSLAQLCREKSNSDPFSGCLFIFRNRSARAIRILAYDGQGFWLSTKRLSKGRFRWWPTGAEAGRSLRAHQAQMLLAGGDPETEAAPI